MNLLRTMVYFATLCFCLWTLIRKRLQWRIPLVLVAAQVVWAAWGFWGGTDSQILAQMRLPHPAAAMPQSAATGSGDGSSYSAGYDAGYSAGGTAGLALARGTPSFLWLFVFAGAGLAVGAGKRAKWRSLQLVCRGEIFNRVVGTPVALGMLGGIGIAVLPYLLVATKWVPGSELSLRSADALLAPLPATTAIRMYSAVLGLLVFGFLFPLAERIRKAPLRWAALVPVGVLLVAKWMPFETAAPNVAAAVAVFGAYLLLYVHGDLLAAMIGMIAARAVIVPCVLLCQPVRSARESAFWLLILGAAAIITSVYWALRGGEPDEPRAFYPLAGAETTEKPDRERLQAEFQVARKAQQDALPAGAPVVDGYSLAGWCEPALQVGGDLYGYFPLPDGRLGVAVADVSGKGVPAALYMMVTKGLLSAVTRDSSGLAYILEQINLHLYRACRRKVFVTMAAVVLDPSSRRVQYGRAGHNPVVWRRARLGGTVLVKPPGLGLGMTRAERFARILAIEDLDLESGDAIVLYSDGITEAVNEAMEQFGEERLMRSVESTDGQSATESQAAILRDLARFMGPTPARDDITLVVIRAV
jgi:Stage II sporulation protein E (SpoIIE)